MKYALEFQETSGGSGGFDDIEADNIDDATEKAIKFVRNNALGKKGTEIEWSLYPDNNGDVDYENPFAKGNLFLERFMTFKPVPRKGTVKLLKLCREATEGSKEAADELLEYIGTLESSEASLLRSIRLFSKEFDEDSFTIYGRKV